MFYTDIILSLDTSDNEYNDTDDDDVGVSGTRVGKTGNVITAGQASRECAELGGSGKRSVAANPAVLKQRITIIDQRDNEKPRTSAALQSRCTAPLTVDRRRIGSQSTARVGRYTKPSPDNKVLTTFRFLGTLYYYTITLSLPFANAFGKHYNRTITIIRLDGPARMTTKNKIVITLLLSYFKNIILLLLLSYREPKISAMYNLLL